MNSRVIISLAMFILATTLLSNTESMLGVSAKVLEQSYKSEGGVMNSSDEITLIVSGDGTTKSEATKIALRSAIEQAYGAFVSSNTTILNDELVKDEIVTISNGNIKSYKEVASALLPNGLTTVTLQTVVSISNLVSYAKSKGASAEFAGASFGMGMKMKELNKENEMIALNNLLEQVRALVPTAFDKELILEEPKVTSTVDFIKYFAKELFHEDYLRNFVEESWELRNIVTNYYDRLRDHKVVDNKKRAYLDELIFSADNSYLMTLSVKFKHNNNTKLLLDLISSTLKSIALTDEKKSEYERQNVPLSKLIFKNYAYYVRSTLKDINTWRNELKKMLENEIADFKIVDNLGVESSFDGYTAINIKELRGDYYLRTSCSPYSLNGVFHSTLYDKDEEVYRLVEGKGLFNGALVNLEEWNSGHYLLHYEPVWEVIFLIEKDNIMKYNNFRIERKN